MATCKRIRFRQIARMNYWLARDGKTYGPFPEAEMIRALRQAQLYVGDHLAREDIQVWVPAFVWAEERVLAGLGVALITPKQKALTAFLGVQQPLERKAATEILDHACSDPANADKLQRWDRERHRRHPDLYGLEEPRRSQSVVHMRPLRVAEIYHHINTDLGEFHPFHRVLKREIEMLVQVLDEKQPGWDLDDEGWPVEMWQRKPMDAVYDAVRLHLPHKVKKGW